MRRQVKELNSHLYYKCSKCFVLKPIENFSKNNRVKSGLCTWCKECTKNYKKFYYEINRTKILSDQKKHYEQNNAEILKRNKKWREENKEIKKASDKRYYERSREAIRGKQKKYYQKNRNTLLKKQSLYGKKNRNRLSEYFSKYRESNKEKIASIRRKSEKKAVELLTDSYVKSKLTERTSLSRSDIPIWLIEFKRAFMKNNRLIKQQNNGKG